MAGGVLGLAGRLGGRLREVCAWAGCAASDTLHALTGYHVYGWERFAPAGWLIVGGLGVVRRQRPALVQHRTRPVLLAADVTDVFFLPLPRLAWHLVLLSNFRLPAEADLAARAAPTPGPGPEPTGPPPSAPAPPCGPCPPGPR